mgnify:CR=1 FL=1
MQGFGFHTSMWTMHWDRNGAARTIPEPVLSGAAMLGALHAHRFRAYEAFQEAERLLRAGPVHE